MSDSRLDEFVVGVSEALGPGPFRDAADREAFQQYAGTRTPLLDPKDLHKYYTAAQLELALIRAKSLQLDKRIEDLKAQAAKLQAELAVKEKT